jgi:hypothetical protein
MYVWRRVWPYDGQKLEELMTRSCGIRDWKTGVRRTWEFSCSLGCFLDTKPPLRSCEVPAHSSS